MTDSNTPINGHAYIEQQRKREHEEKLKAMIEKMEAVRVGDASEPKTFDEWFSGVYDAPVCHFDISRKKDMGTAWTAAQAAITTQMANDLKWAGFLQQESQKEIDRLWEMVGQRREQRDQLATIARELIAENYPYCDSNSSYGGWEIQPPEHSPDTCYRCQKELQLEAVLLNTEVGSSKLGGENVR